MPISSKINKKSNSKLTKSRVSLFDTDNSEEKLNIITKNIKDAIFAKDKNRRYIFVNPAAAEMMMLSINKIIGKTAEQIFSKKDAEVIKNVDNLNFKGKSVDKVESITVGKQERFLHTIQNPFKDSKGRIVGIVGTVKDITEQKKIEEALKESEYRFRMLVENSPFSIELHDKEGNLVKTNQAWEKLWGLKPNDAIGKFNILKDKQAKEMGIDKYFRRATKGEIVTLPDLKYDATKAVGKGRYRWLRSTFYPINGRTEVVEYVVIVHTDITEEKISEKALKESEERYRLLYQTSSDAIMTLEPPDWNFTSGNLAMIKMFGVKNEKEFTSLRPWEVSPKYQPDGQLSSVKAKKMIKMAMKKGENFFEWTHKKVHGDNFFATVLLNRVEANGKTFLQARVSDITEKKKAEEQIKESEAKYRSLSERSRDGIAIVGLDGTMKYVNPYLAELLGYKESEIIGENVLKFTHPDFHEATLDIIKKFNNGVVDWRFEAADITKDGRRIDVEDTVGLLQFEGERCGLVIVRDISQRKKNEQNTLEINEKLRRLNFAMVGRENRMVEIKKENERLKKLLEKYE